MKKKLRAKTALHYIPLVLALLQGGGALDPNAKFNPVPNEAWLLSPGRYPVSVSRTKDEELLKQVLPRVSFDCLGKAGYFSDSDFHCEVFHYCKPNGIRNTFHCPPNTMFNQLSLLCEAKTELNRKLCFEGSITTKASNWSPIKLSSLQKLSPTTVLYPHHRVPTSTRSPLHKNTTDKNVVTFKHFMTLLTNEDGTHSKVPFHESSTPDMFPNQASDPKSFSEIAPPKSILKIETPNNTAIPDTIIISATVASDLKSPTNINQIKKATQKVESKLKIIDANSANKTDTSDSDHNHLKSRYHKRKGKILDLETSESETITKRNVDNTADETTTIDESSDTESGALVTVPSDIEDVKETPVTKTPSLFALASDRNKSRDYRKRKRNSRKRKARKFGNNTSTDPPEEIPDVEITTVTPTNDDRPRRHKIAVSEKNGEPNSGRWHGISNLEDGRKKRNKVSIRHEISPMNDSIAQENNRNPFYQKSNNDQSDLHFGERNPLDKNIDEDHHYGDDDGKMGPSNYFGYHALPPDSIEGSSEENYQKEIYQENKHRNKKISPSRRPKRRKKKRPSYTESDASWMNDSKEEDDERDISTEDPFLPPKLKSSKHGGHSKPEYHSNHEYEEHHSKAPYKEHYFPNEKELSEPEENRWKVNDHDDNEKKKINVGDSIDNGKENIKPNFLMDMPTIHNMQKSLEAMNAIKASVKHLPKHTAAHQHLSKLMNEFFSMSSQNQPSVNLKSSQSGANIHIPKYRIPDEDIYQADAEAEPIENLPQEILDVVEFITEQQAMKKEPQNYDNHQIVKVKAPIKAILGEELSKLFTTNDNTEENTHISLTPEANVPNMVFLPEGSESDEDDEEEFKEIAELASFTSERIEPLLKSVLGNDKQLLPTSIISPPKQTEASISLAKAIPVKVLYQKNFLNTAPIVPQQASFLPTTRKPSFKLVHARLPSPNLQVIHNNRMVPSPNSQFIVLRPSSLVPPHPPPLRTNPVPSLLNYPRYVPTRPINSPFQLRSRRRKRSLVSRLRRQVTFNPNNNPFYNPFFKSYNPNFTPHFRNFRNLFGSPSSILLNTAGSHNFPFTFPTVRVPKFQRPSQSFASLNQPLGIHQTSHQTMVVDDLNLPAHAQTPLLSHSSQIKPLRPLQQPFYSQLRPTYSGSRQPPRIHQPPLVNNHLLRNIPPKHHSYLSTPFPLGVQHHNLPPKLAVRNPQPSYLNSVSTIHDPKSSSPIKIPPIPANLPDQILPLALPVARITPKPILKATGQPKPLLYSPYNSVKPIPHTVRNQLIGHLNSFPGMGKPFGEGSNHFTPNYSGLLMHSGYKPPRTSQPYIKHSNTTNKNKPSKSKPHSSSYREPPAGYLEITYKKNLGRTTSKPAYVRHPIPSGNHKKSKPFGMPQVRNPSQSNTQETSNVRPIPIYSFTNSYPSIPYSGENKPKRKRPSRRRKPKIRPSVTYAASPSPAPLPPSRPTLIVSPTPPPPQQIPPPPADFTSKPYQSSEDISNSIYHGSSVEAKSTNKQSNLFPPAGYYGRDQLGQFFENIKKNELKPSAENTARTPNKNIEESRSVSSFPSTSSSIEDVEIGESGDEPVFGARLSSRNRKKSKDYKPAQTQRTETRTTQNFQEIPRNLQEPPIRVNIPDPDRRNNLPPPPPPPPPRRRKPLPPRPQKPPEKSHSESPPQELKYPKPVTPSSDFFNVPGGLGNIVAPEAQLQPGGNVPRDMFGIPIPFGDQDIFSSLRPADLHHRNFFSVPGHIAKQQLAPLQKERPQSFSPPIEKHIPPKIPSDSSAPKLNTDERPKRRKRIKIKGRPKAPQEKPKTTTEDSATDSEIQSITKGSTFENKIPFTTTRLQFKPTPPPPRYQSEKRLIESPKKPNLPPTLQEVSKSLSEGKLDIKKLNATISTSVSVSASKNGQPLDIEPKKVFSSKNGGLAVIKNGPRHRKRLKPPKFTMLKDEDESSTENGIKSDEKLQIASSVIDIIKATSETERKQATTTTDPSMLFSSTRLSKTWILKPPDDKESKKKTR